MIEHVLAHRLGLIHVLAALVAIGAGAVVVCMPKGTRRHRWTGRFYLGSMLIMNLTALANYELYGRFGPFHWMVLVSLLTLAGGYAAARRRAPGWTLRHGYLMGGSYVGLMAAAVAEVVSRVPGWPFGPSVTISSLVTIALGLWILFRTVPKVAQGPWSRTR